MAKGKGKKTGGSNNSRAVHGKAGRPGTVKTSKRSGKGAYNKNKKSVPVHAPYNFVPFCEEVYEYPVTDIPKQNDMRPDLLSGEIEYMVTSLSPIFINAGEQGGKQAGFYKDPYGRFAVPGSTMRGMIRSNLQILGLANLRNDVQDQRLMYRNIAGAGLNRKVKEHYDDILGTSQINQNKHQLTVIKNVQGGYIENTGGKYYIRRAVSIELSDEYGSMNYYTIRDSHDGRCGADLGSVKNASWRNVWYSVSDQGDINVSFSEKPEMNKGILLKSGSMPKKKAVYIIQEIDESADAIRIPDEDIKNFRIDYNTRENQLRDNSDFYTLPEPGTRKPVFFIELNDRLYFGFTPHLRIYYNYPILEGMPHKPTPEGMTDYCRAIFGEVSGDNGIKSRVSFTDAGIDNNQTKAAAERKVILSSPKPTNYLDYLEQDSSAPGKGKVMSYNDKGFRLRGVKQYWLHEGREPKKVTYDKNKLEQYSSLMPLPAGEVFAGKVRFRNLTKEELGLLLWSIRLNKGCQMNVGMAKSYGYGKIDLTIKSLSLKNLEKSYDLTKGLSLDTGELAAAERIDEFIQEYKKAVNQWLGGNRKIDDLTSIRAFFSMKTPGAFDKRDIPVYMQIEKYAPPGKRFPNGRNKMNEFVEAHRTRVLPDVREIDARRSELRKKR